MLLYTRQLSDEEVASKCLRSGLASASEMGANWRTGRKEVVTHREIVLRAVESGWGLARSGRNRSG